MRSCSIEESLTDWMRSVISISAHSGVIGAMLMVLKRPRFLIPTGGLCSTSWTAQY